MQPVISIVIPVYNRERYLDAAIASVLGQTRQDFELLIWDDGSSDRSPEIAREYERRDQRVRLVVAKNQGTTKALKAAIAQTHGKYIGWVDSDDLLAPTALAETTAVLDSQLNIGWVYTDYLDIDVDDQILSYGYRCLIPYNREELLNKFMTFHFRLIRREVFELAGGIDDSLASIEDYDLCLRLSEVSQVKHIFKPLYYYRCHSENLSIKSAIIQAKAAHKAVKKAQQRRKTQLKQASLVGASLLLGLWPNFAQAQSIAPANDGTGTVVNQQGNHIDISGGSLSSDRANLFHNFSQFGLDANQTANFLSQPQIQNILGRITSGNASYINGLIQVTGGNSNLYLINPNGIIFGNNASLNVPAAFTATTANHIGFTNAIFHADGWNNYASLLGNPQSFIFDANSTGVISNSGNLAVSPGNNLTLLASTVTSFGELSAPGGNITVASVPNSSLVRLSIPGNLLSLEILNPSSVSNNSPNSLANLLTGSGVNHATQLKVNQNGEVELVGSGLQVNQGDVVVQKATAETVNIQANQNLILPESKITSTGNLNLIANHTLQVRDSAANRVTVIAGKNLYLQGNQGIDILAINHPDRNNFISGGDLTLVSNGLISLDTHFASGGKFSIINNQGNRSNFISLYDPIISSNGDVTFGDYKGPALKVESRGSITAGNITIDSPDSTLCPSEICSPDEGILASEPALILRAGLSSLESTANIPPDFIAPGTVFSTTGTASTPANIQVGNIDTSDSIFGFAGRVILQSVTGNIQTGEINASGSISSRETSDVFSGLVDIQAQGNVITSNINTSAINTSSNSDSQTNAGAVSIKATTGNITTGTINAFAISAYGNILGGNVNLEGKNIIFDSINTTSQVTEFGFGTANAGDVNVLGNGVVRGLGVGDTIATFGEDTSGEVKIRHDGGVDNDPFVVGDASKNGTAGSINAGSSQITPASLINTFPVLANGGLAIGTPIGITIESINTPPTLTANSNIPSTQANQSVKFKISDLSVGNSDINQDNLTITLTELKTGTLTLENGTPISTGTTIDVNTVLVYTPPTNTTGNITAFSITASDRVSLSSPQDITIQVTPPPEIPTIPDDSPNPTILEKTPSVPDIPTVAKGIPDPVVGEIDEGFTADVQQYLGQTSLPKIATTNTAQNILQNIEKSTGVKPAIIYVTFVPPTISTSNQDARSKALNINSPDDRLELVVVTGKSTPVRKVLPVTRSQILAVARTFKSRVTDPALRRDYFDAAKQLYSWLIEPIDSDLQTLGIQNLVFIMDSGLRSLPVAALYNGQQYLVEKYSVGLMPSLSLTDTRYVDIKKAQVLGMGASQFSNQQPLPAVPTELKTISPRLWSGKTFLNEAFTLENLQTQRQQTPFGIIHLATHGEFRPGAPGNSYIQLWDTQLRMDQIRRLGWSNPPVELVVLSACRTAFGDEEAELGFAGFAVQAGAKSALASLWYISDEGTLGFISEFYERLKTAPIKAEALRQAQVAALKGEIRLAGGKLETTNSNVILPPVLANLGNKDISHPYFWSAFIMIGNPW